VYRKIFLLLMLVIYCFPNTLQAFERKGKPGKYAIMFIDPKVKASKRQMAAMKIPLEADKRWYAYKGYNWVIRDTANSDFIAEAILDSKVKAIAYYGHGSSGDPTFGEFTSNGWQEFIKNKIKQNLTNQGYSEKAADAIAYQNSLNFDLQDVVNRSCGSLKTTSIADRFVRKGEKYYGCRADNYRPLSPLGVCSDTDCMIEEYTSKGTVGPKSRKVHCKGHQLYCKQKGTVYSYPKTALDTNLDEKCDKCGLPYIIERRLAPGLRGVQRGDVWCRDNPNF